MDQEKKQTKLHVTKSKKGPEHFFPGIHSYDKRYKVAELEYLVPHHHKKRVREEELQHEVFPFTYEEEEAFDSIQAEYDFPPRMPSMFPTLIEKGKHFDVISLLSSNFNDDGMCSNGSAYLVRSNSGDRVEVESLKGKYIMLCCFFIPCYSDGMYCPAVKSISLASHDLSRREDFEVVLVLKMRPHWACDESAFNHFLSAFSCLVVPFGDPLRRDFICRSLNLEGREYKGVLVDPNQVVVQDKVRFLCSVGVHAFPFTDDRIRFYTRGPWEGKSLEELLGCESSDYLYRNWPQSEEKVQISELKKKVVGLYLCIDGHEIPTLEGIHQKCRARGLDFEIVLVYTPFANGNTSNVFQEVINWVLEERKISWWVFPFNYSVCKRLFLLSRCCPSDQLVVVTPQGQVDPQGLQVIENIGIKAYPFTRENIFKTILHRLEQLTLESLLEGGFLYRTNNNGVCVEVSSADLRGKPILIYVGWVEKETSNLYLLLCKYYDVFKAKDRDFEVVFVCVDNEISNKGKERVSTMPWLVLQPSPSKLELMKKAVFIQGFREEKLIAYGKDGHICSINGHGRLISHKDSAFPFIGDVIKEIISELNSCYGPLFMHQMVWSDSYLKTRSGAKIYKRLTSSPTENTGIRCKRVKQKAADATSSAVPVLQSRLVTFPKKI